MNLICKVTIGANNVWDLGGLAPKARGYLNRGICENPNVSHLCSLKMYGFKRVFHLELVSRIPLTAPNVDKATNTGIVHAIGPYSLSANV